MFEDGFNRAEILPYNGKLSNALEELVDALETVIEFCDGGIEAVKEQVHKYKMSRVVDGFDAELPRGVCESFELLNAPLEGIITLLPKIKSNDLGELTAKVGELVRQYTGGTDGIMYGFFMDIFTPPEQGGEFIAKLASGNEASLDKYLTACREGIVYLREGWELVGEERDLSFRRESDGYEMHPRESMRIDRGFSYLLPDGQGRVDVVLADGSTEKLLKAMPPTGDKHGLDYALTIRVTGNDALADYLVRKLDLDPDDTYRGATAHYGEVTVSRRNGVGTNKLNVELVPGEPRFEPEEGLETETLGLLRELMDPMFISPNAVHPKAFRIEHKYRKEAVGEREREQLYDTAALLE